MEGNTPTPTDAPTPNENTVTLTVVSRMLLGATDTTLKALIDHLGHAYATFATVPLTLTYITLSVAHEAVLAFGESTALISLVLTVLTFLHTFAQE